MDSSFKEYYTPPLAPILRPSEDEFEDPMAYFAKIRPSCERYGIVKIIPPSSWKSTFKFDEKKFIFQPRLQNLRELNAITRDSYEIFKQLDDYNMYIAKKSPIRKVRCGKKMVDIYCLYRAVKDYGGFEACDWAAVAKEVDIPERNISQLKTAYAKHLLGFVNRKEKLSEAKAELSQESNTFLSDDDVAMCKERCIVCQNFGKKSAMTVCCRCGDAYHISCIPSSLSQPLAKNWTCSRCVVHGRNTQNAYGFQQDKHVYSLSEFGYMANKFKEDYFRKQKTLTSQMLETEFWRIVTSTSEDVIVKYGADLSSAVIGSGFFTMEDKLNSKNDEKIAKSPWNLNNIPCLPGSVLSYVDGKISGVKVPWVYIGMCFSTFCWHTEDHWSYSINYLHWGDLKTWYGVPGSDADLLEKAIRIMAPELFHKQPDLMHQLVTLIDPVLLRKHGVHVYSIHQFPGEFVLTFPRSYHAGFNHGFNCAEAVNICPPDWIPIGRKCVDLYKSVSRLPVFSHDEVIFKMAWDKNLNKKLLMAVYTDVQVAYEREKVAKQDIENLKLVEEQCKFEELPDDSRKCVDCATTLFLSAIECRCKPKSRMACLQHARSVCRLCNIKNCKLRYRLTLSEIQILVDQLWSRIEGSEEWFGRAMEILYTHKDGNEMPKLETLIELVKTAKDKGYRETTLLKNLEDTIALVNRNKLSVARLMDLTRSLPHASADISNAIESYKKRPSLTLVEKILHSIRTTFVESAEDEIAVIAKAKAFENKVINWYTELDERAHENEVEELKLNWNLLYYEGLNLEVVIEHVLQLHEFQNVLEWIVDAYKSVKILAGDMLLSKVFTLRKDFEMFQAKNSTLNKMFTYLRNLNRILQRDFKFVDPDYRKKNNNSRQIVLAKRGKGQEMPNWRKNLSEYSKCAMLMRHSLNYGTTLFQLAKLRQRFQLLPIEHKPRHSAEFKVSDEFFDIAELFLNRITREFYCGNVKYFSISECLLPKDANKLQEFRHRLFWKMKEQTAQNNFEEDSSGTMLNAEKTSWEALVPFFALHCDFKEKMRQEELAMKEIWWTWHDRIVQARSEKKGIIPGSTCICDKGVMANLLNTPFAVQCFTCQEVYHATCVVKSNWRLSYDSVGLFICPKCYPINRPNYEDIKHLLIEYRGIYVGARPVPLYEIQFMEYIVEYASGFSNVASSVLDLTKTTDRFNREAWLILQQAVFKGLMCRVILPELLSLIKIYLKWTPQLHLEMLDKAFGQNNGECNLEVDFQKTGIVDHLFAMEVDE
ncbi:Lysine-specific demethylase 5A [Trichinella pseudospiralis]|uniref:[histone H3]-trimethyl-L-lysine(4) demethylase n=1 Tax=Trichinella pseudospiralis TaxID=6337 RepID=A0A0V1K3X9_TRIPS|nr:Lysine-specific demethylase 5A [Trichinella pseudospiralis]